jgi:hypothetical protein
MAQDFLKPTRVPTSDLGKRKMEDGMFRNPPTYSELGGFTSADKGKFQNNKMTLERGGPTAQKGRPI